MIDRLKEIKHRQWEINEAIKILKNESKELRQEERQILGYHRIEQVKQKYRKGKRR